MGPGYFDGSVTSVDFDSSLLGEDRGGYYGEIIIIH